LARFLVAVAILNFAWAFFTGTGKPFVYSPSQNASWAGACSSHGYDSVGLVAGVHFVGVETRVAICSCVEEI
jgi:hypothetical protein